MVVRTQLSPRRERWSAGWGVCGELEGSATCWGLAAVVLGWHGFGGGGGGGGGVTSGVVSAQSVDRPWKAAVVGLWGLVVTLLWVWW